jgi:hypothetical protein
MMCGTAENRAEGMEGNGGGLPKWWKKAGFGRMCSTFWAVFSARHAEPVGIILQLRWNSCIMGLELQRSVSEKV